MASSLDSQLVLTRSAKRALEAAVSPQLVRTRQGRRVREETPVASGDDLTEGAGERETGGGYVEAKVMSDTRQEVHTSEADSVLFSEQTAVLGHGEADGVSVGKGALEVVEEEYFMVEDAVPNTLDSTTLGDHDGYLAKHETSTAVLEKKSADRSLMPPPLDTLPRKTRSTSLHAPSENSKPDRMTRVLEKQRKRSFVEIDFADGGSGEEESDNGEDMFEESYHSGDTDDYEMGHRPILQRTAIKKDIRDFTQSIGILRDGVDGEEAYRVVDRLGEGTFSSVYLARDMLYHLYDNEYWSGLTDDDPDEDPTRDVRVALKKILVTSSAVRIENELAILENLRGCRNVSQLITAFREEDQVIIVLPYHPCDDFRHFYKHMDLPHIRSYMRDLFRSLKDTHRRGIIHRDVKPANFLFDYEREHGVLVDFGLAERYCPPVEPTCQHAPATIHSLHGSKVNTGETAVVEQAVYDARKRSKLGEGRVGFPHEDKRPAIRTNRAGTRGFRAPEVLLKCPDQTVALDVWSAGVVLFSIVTQKFPAFNSSDDIEALMEIAAIFGRTALERCALLHNRTMISNVPTLDSPPASLTELILRLNPHLYTPHSPNPTPEEAAEHICLMDHILDLLSKLLRLDATKRLTAAQALRHPFLAGEDGEWDEPEDDEMIDDIHEVPPGEHDDDPFVIEQPTTPQHRLTLESNGPLKEKNLNTPDVRSNQSKGKGVSSNGEGEV
nr:CDC7 protein kinase [Cryptococcus depauperatus CBS 7841]